MTITLPPPPKQPSSQEELEQWLHRLWFFLTGGTGDTVNSKLDSHIADFSNPHGTSKSQILGSDPISDSDVSDTANINWTKISKTGSSLADLTTRAAVDVVNSATGNVSSTNVQDAINELQSDIDSRLPTSGGLLSGTLQFDSDIGFEITESTNGRMGVATLSSGTVTVANTSITADTRIFLTGQDTGTSDGFLTVSARSAGVSFTITSSDASDDRVIAYLLVEPV